MKILTMNGIQLCKKNREYIVTVPGTMTSEPSLQSLEDLKELNEEYFSADKIELKKSPHGEGISDKYLITYTVPLKVKTLLSVKGSSEILRLSLLNEILKLNPLQRKSKYIPLIHPANIFFADMRTIKFLYTDNGELYQDNTTELEQYKALVISCLTKYSYEALKTSVARKERLMKLNNMFLIQIEKANTVEELQQMINTRLNKLESDYFLFNQEQEAGHKKTFKILIAIIVALGITCFVLLILLLMRG